ncbi:MAG: flavodoxin domain-containing protein [Candidatus Bathyarchaeia archaeon]
MVKVLVVYESKYGNTKRVAEEIINGIKVGDADAFITEVKEVDLDMILDYDAILIGSPNHIGGPTRGIKGFIDKLGKIQLKGKTFAVFDTYLGNDFEKAVKKMEKQISEKIQGVKPITPGLSVKVKGIKGPIVEEELQKCVEFGKKLAIQLESTR